MTRDDALIREALAVETPPPAQARFSAAVLLRRASRWRAMRLADGLVWAAAGVGCAVVAAPFATTELAGLDAGIDAPTLIAGLAAAVAGGLWFSLRGGPRPAG